MNLEKLGDLVWKAMESGVTALAHPPTRAIVDEALRRNRILQNPEQFGELALMKHLCFAVIRDWPACTTLQFIEPYLEALRDIRLAMNESEVYENVAVFDDPCRIQDGRRNLDDFKRALTELVLHEWAESEADEGRNALGTGDSFA